MAIASYEYGTDCESESTVQGRESIIGNNKDRRLSPAGTERRRSCPRPHVCTGGHHNSPKVSRNAVNSGTRLIGTPSARAACQ